MLPGIRRAVFTGRCIRDRKEMEESEHKKERSDVRNSGGVKILKGSSLQIKLSSRWLLEFVQTTDNKTYACFSVGSRLNPTSLREEWRTITFCTSVPVILVFRSLTLFPLHFISHSDYSLVFLLHQSESLLLPKSGNRCFALLIICSPLRDHCEKTTCITMLPRMG